MESKRKILFNNTDQRSFSLTSNKNRINVTTHSTLNNAIRNWPNKSNKHIHPT